MTYGGEERVLVDHADADGSIPEDRQAISGFASMVDGGTVSWSSKRQEIVSLSMTESEYVAATHAVKEVLWLRSLFGQRTYQTDPELSMQPGPNGRKDQQPPTTLFCDNQSAN